MRSSLLFILQQAQTGVIAQGIRALLGQLRLTHLKPRQVGTRKILILTSGTFARKQEKQAAEQYQSATDQDERSQDLGSEFSL
jgi:hypothetical protein